jgi:DNA primase
MCPSLTGSNDEDRHFFHGRNRKKVMLLELYSQIKEQVSTREVAEHYDHKVKRNGMMLCPFHEDKILSMKVDKNFICFGCQEKGDVIRFAAKLFGLPPYDAAGKLIEDMALTVTAESRQEVQLGIRQKARYKLTE